MVRIVECEIPNCNETVELENKRINEPYRCKAHQNSIVIGEEVN